TLGFDGVFPVNVSVVVVSHMVWSAPACGIVTAGNTVMLNVSAVFAQAVPVFTVQITLVVVPADRLLTATSLPVWVNVPASPVNLLHVPVPTVIGWVVNTVSRRQIVISASLITAALGTGSTTRVNAVELTDSGSAQ